MCKKLTSLLLALCMVLCVSTCFAYADSPSSATLNNITCSTTIQNGNIVETAHMIDSDGVPATLIKTTSPNNTYTLELIKNGKHSIDVGRVNYDAVFAATEDPLSISPYKAKPNTTEVFLGTASNVTYIGPEWRTASDLANIITCLMSTTTLQVATTIAGQICSLFASPVPLWIKKVTSSYEVHGVGGAGFLGYYHMYDSFYTYTHSDTTGPDYLQPPTYADRFGNTPGV